LPLSRPPSHGKHVHRIGKPARREWAPSGLAHTADTAALNAFSAERRYRFWKHDRLSLDYAHDLVADACSF
jgi:hypothetical protein